MPEEEVIFSGMLNLHRTIYLPRRGKFSVINQGFFMQYFSISAPRSPQLPASYNVTVRSSLLLE
jgi:hypothetical protein